jgi:hypothetical protein
MNRWYNFSEDSSNKKFIDNPKIKRCRAKHLLDVMTVRQSGSERPVKWGTSDGIWFYCSAIGPTAARSIAFSTFCVLYPNNSMVYIDFSSSTFAISQMWMSAGSIREFGADLKSAWTGRLIHFVEFEFNKTGQTIQNVDCC